MQINEIIKQINEAASDNITVNINCYASSDGSTKDYKVKFLPKGGYKNLVQESLDILNSKVKFYISELKPADADIGEWATAVNEQITSFQKSINNENTVIYNSKVETVKLGRVYVIKDELESGEFSTAILKNLINEGDASMGNSEKIPKGNIPRYKHMIRSTLPIALYIPQLNLTPGKFGSVDVY